jgi:hypothetical protein
MATVHSGFFDYAEGRREIPTIVIVKVGISHIVLTLSRLAVQPNQVAQSQETAAREILNSF